MFVFADDLAAALNIEMSELLDAFAAIELSNAIKALGAHVKEDHTRSISKYSPRRKNLHNELRQIYRYVLFLLLPST